MTIYLDPPAYQPGGPDGQGWNRLSLNAHMSDPKPQCALRPRSFATLAESYDTRRARYGGFGPCVMDGPGNCNDACPVFAGLREPKRLEHVDSRVLFRLERRSTGAFPGSTLVPGVVEVPHLVSRTDDGWASESTPWTWEELARLQGWRVNGVHRDEHGEGFWLRKENADRLDGRRFDDTPAAQVDTGQRPGTVPGQPASPEARWVMRDVRRYNWSQCRYCGRAQEHDCAPATCMLCGTVQCHSNGTTCSICLHGYIPGWSRSSDDRVCGRKGCDQAAVTKAPRVGRVCVKHAESTKLRLGGGRSVTLVEYAGERVAHRDSGKGWEFWRFVDHAPQQQAPAQVPTPVPTRVPLAAEPVPVPAPDLWSEVLDALAV